MSIPADNWSYIRTGLGLDATEPEIRRTLLKPSEVIEWETGGMTFLLGLRPNDKEYVIVRAGALGGDVRNVHGGWRYLRLVDCMKEWAEIRLVAGAYRQGQGKAKIPDA